MPADRKRLPFAQTDYPALHSIVSRYGLPKGVSEAQQAQARGELCRLIEQERRDVFAQAVDAAVEACLGRHRRHIYLATKAPASEVIGTRNEHGYTLLVPKSKEDQEGEGFEKLVTFAENERYCPVKLLRHWLDVSGIASGPIFRPVSRYGKLVQYGEREGLWPQYVDKVVKKLLKRSGVDPQGYGAHSLRAGFVTQAALLGRTENEIMRHTGHATPQMVQRYIRIAELHKRNATKRIGL